MKKRQSRKKAPGEEVAHQTVRGEAARHPEDGTAGHRTEPGAAPNQTVRGAAETAEPKAGRASTDWKPQLTDGSTAREKAKTADVTEVVNDVLELEPELKALVNRMLQEGSTFEDVAEGVNARGGRRLTLNAVKSYFQGNRELQTQRGLRQVEDAEALLASLDKDPRSAEARLARATFLTGYSRVHRNASEVTPREAARYRMECENLNLKHQILMMQRKKAEQDLEYSRARTNLIQITQGKMQGEILRLERELTAHQIGDPLAPDILQRIQQLYGLASQPLQYEETVDALAKA
jgi:hypothetical protein